MQPVVCLEFLPSVVQSPWFEDHEGNDNTAEQYQARGDADLAGPVRRHAPYQERIDAVLKQHVEEAERDGAEENAGSGSPATDDQHAHIPDGINELEVGWRDSPLMVCP